jgi:Domain of unknown function (DUF4129)
MPVRLADAGMELCWLFAWAAFLLAALFQYTLRFPVVLSVFATGYAVTVLGRTFGHRPGGVLFFRLCAFILLYAVLMQGWVMNRMDGWPVAWISALAKGHRSIGQWCSIVLFTVLILAIYRRGGLKPDRTVTGGNIYAHFDAGLGAFFVLCVVKIFLAVKGVSTVKNPALNTLFFPFLLMGLLAVGTIRSRSAHPKDYASKFQEMGVMLLFWVVVCLSGACIAWLFHAHLTAGAGQISEVLKNHGKRLVPLLVSILRFLLMHRGAGQDAGPSLPDRDLTEISPMAAAGRDFGLPGQVVGWAIAGFWFLLFMLLCYSLVKKLIRYLFRSAPGTGTADPGRFTMTVLCRRAKKAYRLLKSTLMGWVGGPANAMALFAALMAWGRHSGRPRRPTETPREYGHRLINHFPVLEKEIGTLIALVNREVFGETELKKEDLVPGKRAWKELRRPKYWPLRLKTFLFLPLQNPDQRGSSVSAGKALPGHGPC